MRYSIVLAAVLSPLLQFAGADGLVVQLGCGDGRKTAKLSESGRCIVHGLDADPARVAEARRYIRSRGLYGRLSVDVLSGSRLPYADNLVNRLVVERRGGVSREEVMDWVNENIDFSQFKSPMQAMAPIMKHFGKRADGNMVKGLLQELSQG